ncbi:MAG: flagellar motor switch protein FliG, partial [Planctomycetota bacterium]
MAEGTAATAQTGEEAPALRGTTKAAILLLAMSDEAAAGVLKLLPQEVVEDVTRQIATLDMVDPGARAQVIEEFYHLAMARQHAEIGGLGYAKVLLEKALPADEAGRVLGQVASQVYQQPFSFLAKTDGENLLTFIQEEHPQTIALILSHLPAGRASEILVGLPHAKQLEVVTRVANMEQTNPEVIKEVERGLELRLSGIVSQTFEKAGGVEAVAEMLNLSDRATEKGILEALESEDPDLVEQIRRLMFVFEDILL